MKIETKYQICDRCVMDTTDPNIVFDGDGVCSHCHDYDNRVTKMSVGHTAERDLNSIVEQIKRDGKGKAYDAVIGVSGGVDSSYVAWLVKSLGLRAVAVHVDNGWNTEIAVRNIWAVLQKTGTPLHTVVLDWEEFKDIQLAFLKAGTPDAEIPSDHAIFASMHHAASKEGIRHVISGVNTRTESHLPSAWSHGHFDFGYIKAVHRQFGSGQRIRAFPHYTFLQYLTRFRYKQRLLHILDWVDYSKTQAMAHLQNELGWRDYGGKHYENIYTRWFQGVYLPRKFGFDKRRSHLSSRICSGELTREFALNELQKPTYDVDLQQQDCEYVGKKLGLDKPAFNALMNGPLRTFEDYSSYERLLQTRRFRWTLRLWQFMKPYVPLVSPRS